MLVIWIKNFVVSSVKSRLIRNNPVCVNNLVLEFIAQSTDCELSPSDVHVSLGIYCDKLDLFRSVFDNILEKKNNVSIAKVLSNSALLKLDNEESKQNLSWSEFSFVISNLVDDDTVHITADFLCHEVSSFKKAKKKN